jgi:hypothetical protein
MLLEKIVDVLGDEGREQDLTDGPYVTGRTVPTSLGMGTMANPSPTPCRLSTVTK